MLAMCPHVFCPRCNQEMIHRDQRQGHESASALGQIIHREGPNEMTCGDVDLYIAKWRGPVLALKLLEHKRPKQPIGDMQFKTLTAIDALIQHAKTTPITEFPLDQTSGVYIVRGDFTSTADQSVDYLGPVIVTKLDETISSQPKSRTEFYDWLHGGPGWTPRRGRGRYGGNR
jgi:hypothetical protein